MFPVGHGLNIDVIRNKFSLQKRGLSAAETSCLCWNIKIKIQAINFPHRFRPPEANLTLEYTLACNAMYSNESRPTFRRNRLGLTCYLFHAGFLLCLLFNTEDGGDLLLRTVCQLSTDYTASYSPL
jgi:hypothetical protein